MENIKNFEDIFSKKNKKLTKFFLSKTSPIVKDCDVLNIIAATHGFKDYKSAKSLYDDYLKENPRWSFRNDRKYFNIQENFESNDEFLQFLNSLKNKTFLNFNYSFYLSDRTNHHTKKKIKEIIEKHKGILFSFKENSELGFDVDFNIIIESNEKKINAFIADVYVDELKNSSKIWIKNKDEKLVSTFINTFN